MIKVKSYSKTSVQRNNYNYSIIPRAGKSITNPPMNYVYNACCRARKAENQEQWKKRKRISSQLKYLTLMTKKACRTHSASNFDFCKVLPSMQLRHLTEYYIHHKTTCYSPPPLGKKIVFSHDGLNHITQLSDTHKSQ